MEFGELLAHYRRKANLTLRDFAEKVAYDPSNISKIERGRINPPAGGIILRKWGVAVGLKPGSLELEEFVAKGLSVRIKKVTLSDGEIEKLMPAFFRAIDNKSIDPETYEKLKAVLKTHI
jgi:transcriptional regulator with XRE-family HTH domain